MRSGGNMTDNSKLIRDVVNGKPGKNIIPGTQKVINPDTYLRVVASSNLEVTKGEKVTGVTSNAVI